MANFTDAQVRAALAAVKAIADAVQELGEVPAGHLYAQVMGSLTLQEFETIIGMLVSSKLVDRKPSHLLVWIGPAAKWKVAK